MQNDNHIYCRSSVELVLTWLKTTEPNCGDCDHCKFLMNKEECEKHQARAKDSHIEWEKQVAKWKERWKNAE